MAEIGQRGAQVKRAVADTRAVVIQDAAELEEIQRCLDFGEGADERDGVGATARERCQSRSGTKNQCSLRASIGERGVPGIGVELDGGRDILAKTVGISHGKAAKGHLRIFVHRVIATAVGEGWQIVEVGSAQDDVPGDAVVGRVHRGAIGIQGSGAAIRAGRQIAGVVIQAVVGNNANFVVAGICVGAEGDRQRGKDGIDLGFGALHGQGIAALAGKESASTARVGSAVAQLRGGNECCGVIEHLNFNADEIRLACSDAICQIQVGNADAGDGCRARTRGKSVNTARCGQGQNVVPGCNLDVINRWCRCASLREGGGVVNRPVAVAHYIIECVCRGLRSAVPVRNQPTVQVGLGKDGANSQCCPAAQQLAVGRRCGNPVLALHG